MKIISLHDVENEARIFRVVARNISMFSTRADNGITFVVMVGGQVYEVVESVEDIDRLLGE